MKFGFLLLSAAFPLAVSAYPALAQQTGQAQPASRAGEAVLVEIDDGKMVIESLNLTAEQVGDMEVFGAEGERIGEVDDVLMQAGGQIAAVSVEAGGFLGIGGREVIFGVRDLRLQAGRLVTSLTRDEIEALPDWTD